MTFKKGDLVEYRDPRVSASPLHRDFGVVVATSPEPHEVRIFFLNDRETCWVESIFLAMVHIPVKKGEADENDL
jgi:hypothetical protein